jgi:hypothetical protein
MQAAVINQPVGRIQRDGLLHSQILWQCRCLQLTIWQTVPAQLILSLKLIPIPSNGCNRREGAALLLARSIDHKASLIEASG